MTDRRSTKKPTFFAEPQLFVGWLEANHHTASELVVGFYKRRSGKPSITWPESVDAALCYGWIDGIRRRVDDDSYTIRFTPRRPGSIWSAINTRRVGELEAEGRMRPAGRAALAKRSEEKSRLYSYEQVKRAVLEEPYLGTLRKHKKAWAFFQAQAPSYQRQAAHWVMSARAEATRLRRLDKLIAKCADGGRV